jgi:hypothetical protein
MAVDWQGVWNEPTARVRERLGVTAYASPVPADLIEQMRQAGMI